MANSKVPAAEPWKKRPKHPTWLISLPKLKVFLSSVSFRSRGFLVLLPRFLFFCSLSSCFSSLCSCCLCSPNCSYRTGHVSFFAFSYLLAVSQAAEATNSNQLLQPRSPTAWGLSFSSISGTSSASSDSILSPRIPMELSRGPELVLPIGGHCLLL